MKSALKWLKEKWLLPAAGFILIAYAILFRTNRRNVQSLRKLTDENNKTVRQLEETNTKVAAAVQQTEQSTAAELTAIEHQHRSALDEIRKQEEELLAKYELKTNRELAELLKGKN